MCAISTCLCVHRSSQAYVCEYKHLYIHLLDAWLHNLEVIIIIVSTSVGIMVVEWHSLSLRAVMTSKRYVCSQVVAKCSQLALDHWPNSTPVCSTLLIHTNTSSHAPHTFTQPLCCLQVSLQRRQAFYMSWALGLLAYICMCVGRKCGREGEER